MLWKYLEVSIPSRNRKITKTVFTLCLILWCLILNVTFKCTSKETFTRRVTIMIPLLFTLTVGKKHSMPVALYFVVDLSIVYTFFTQYINIISYHLNSKKVNWKYDQRCRYNANFIFKYGQVFNEKGMKFSISYNISWWSIYLKKV